MSPLGGDELTVQWSAVVARFGAGRRPIYGVLAFFGAVAFFQSM